MIQEPAFVASEVWLLGTRGISGGHTIGPDPLPCLPFSRVWQLKAATHARGFVEAACECCEPDDGQPCQIDHSKIQYLRN